MYTREYAGNMVNLMKHSKANFAHYLLLSLISNKQTENKKYNINNSGEKSSHTHNGNNWEFREFNLKTCPQYSLI